MKLISKLVILGQGLDMCTTYAGVTYFGCVEQNPLFSGNLPALFLYKIFVTIILIFILEIYKSKTKFIWIVPATAIFPGLWNLGQILKVLIYAHS